MADQVDWETLDELALEARQARSEERVTKLIEAVTPTVEATVRRWVRQDDAADVVQDVLIRLISRFGSWDPARGSFRTWTTAVSRNAAYDHLRRQQRAGELLQAEVLEEDVDAAPYLAQIEDAALIRSVHEELRARRDVPGRRVVAAARDLAYHGRDLSLAAIAREAELDESTARRAMGRVRLLTEELRKR
jgi:RNA polymerase sigma factor (sigma-70 family)